MRKFLVALLMFCTSLPALAVEDTEPKYIVLSPEECVHMALEVALSAYELKSGNKAERAEALTANAAIVATEIVRLNPSIAQAEPGQLMAYLTDACIGAQGQTEVPEMVRN